MTNWYQLNIKHKHSATNLRTASSLLFHWTKDMVTLVARDLPRARPRPASRPGLGGKPAANYSNNKPQNEKYTHGVTKIDRSKGTGVPWKHYGEQEVVPSLLVGEPRCRECYAEVGVKCDCGKPKVETDVNVYWTAASGYWDQNLLAVRKCEDIAIREARRLGMKCVVLRSSHHNTATKFDATGRKTGHIPADWHITLYLGDSIQKLLLQGHCYTFMGKNGIFPQCKMKPGQRTVLEAHEIIERLTLEEAAPQVYWGINGSCGWIESQGQQRIFRKIDV
jgi:hypothetical protein